MQAKTGLRITARLTGPPGLSETEAVARFLLADLFVGPPRSRPGGNCLMPKALYLRSACLAAMILLGPAPMTLAQAGGGDVLAEGRPVAPRLSGDVFIPPVLTIPQGWREQPVSDGRLVLIGPDGLSMIIAFRETVSLKAASERLGQPIDISAGVSLTPRSLPKTEGDRVRNDFLAFGFEPLTSAQVIIHTEEAGRALILIGLTQAGMDGQLAQALARLSPRPVAVTAPDN
jgi:hypothetical protein